MIKRLSVECEDQTLEITVLRSDRRTISMEIKPDCTVYIRAPRTASDAQIMQFAEAKTGWLCRKYAEMQKRSPGLESAEVNKRQFDSVTVQYYRRRAKEILLERVACFAPVMGVTVNRITIREQKTRWGSCSSKGNLNFNWKLILMPEEILDYVVVHELAHLIEMNHSPAFWQQVEQVLPDYRKRRAWLKQNGIAYL